MNFLTPEITFWVIAATLVAIALAFVLPPLFRDRSASVVGERRNINIAVYRDQMKEMETDHRNGLLSDEQFATARTELEARLAEDAVVSADEAVVSPARNNRKLGYSLAVLIPVAAFSLYSMIGMPGAMQAIADEQANAGAAGGHDIAKMIAQIEERTRTNPEDGKAWAMLGKTYAVTQNWPQAVVALEKANKLLPDTPQVMTAYAEALAINNNRTLQGEPMKLILMALEKDPDDMKGLELAAIHAFQERNYAQAAYYFKRLHKVLPPDDPYAADILEAQKEAARLAHMGETGGLDNLSDPGSAQANAPQPAQPGATIRGTLDIAPALKGKLAPNDTVFLFARPADSGGAPLAALRSTASKFPLQFELNDAMAMNPQMSLSKFKEVTLTARVSKSGDVKAQPGDLEGKLIGVKVGAEGVKLVIDSVKP